MLINTQQIDSWQNAQSPCLKMLSWKWVGNFTFWGQDDGFLLLDMTFVDFRIVVKLPDVSDMLVMSAIFGRSKTKVFDVKLTAEGQADIISA